MRSTILIVDDEPMLLDLFREFLSAYYEVLVADSVDAGIELLEQHAVDAVATDLNCGAESGLALLHWISQRQPALLPASFILSGSHEPEEMEGLEVPVITKPVNLAQLRATFASILGQVPADPERP